MSNYTVIGIDQILAKVHRLQADLGGAGHWQVVPAVCGELDAQEDLAWHEAALCAQTDPEAFFPEKGGSTREAKAMCERCEVKDPCLEYALDNDERFGIWGGLSERERRRLKRGIA
ncbi:WhiB family transcriptional regulator [Mycobacteroides abscessus]|uniref:WhiB family transcriptional regulator n=1 Tax=Mycobacteroides abscessus TaxID=36809 RepID=UPI000928893E|nr:WhiB family transcriptional regulator [Mycobacteroides abscessus]SHY27020.1 WhiB family transcriptional regulator [Mycobacteroides abscessus subsp. abscessus]SID73264.1 Putative transcriptional regulator, WhiB family [Mycobacteroides abscessus subsp. abscessus]SIK17717.1 Putative transcriptional regulator, WhiB family [Mycobacteroides abscessus subsp. abscessus]SIM41891.1 Putative transcriptional regulator, WhiB family [Mycobacteroides abscessus subsp. abscessus]SKM13923.1 WhiB family trans